MYRLLLTHYGDITVGHLWLYNFVRNVHNTFVVLRKDEISAQEILLQEHEYPRPWNILSLQKAESRSVTFRRYQELSLYSAGRLLDIELERTWKEAVMTYCNIVYWHLPEDYAEPRWSWEQSLQQEQHPSSHQNYLLYVPAQQGGILLLSGNVPYCGVTPMGRFTLCVTFPFRHRSVRTFCVDTVRRVQSPSRTARDRRPVIISIEYAVPFVFWKTLAAVALMLDEEEKNAALSDKEKCMC